MNPKIKAAVILAHKELTEARNSISRAEQELKAARRRLAVVDRQLAKIALANRKGT